MKDWPSQHWAAAEWLRLNGGEPTEKWPVDWIPDVVSSEVAEKCDKRLRAIHQMLSDINATEEEVRLKWCEITMNPLINRVMAKSTAVHE
jgi:hypothetical protein